MARRKRGSGGNKVMARKKVTVRLIDREHAGKVTTPYRLMDELIANHHPHLAEAKIAIAWRLGKKADADGRLWLGQAKKGSDMDRTLHGYDFVISLNHEAWNSAQFTEPMMLALMDHELCHCQVAKDSNGDPKTDEEGRLVYRIRKHDLEEFRDVVARHGQWKEDIRAFCESALKDQHEAEDRPLLHPKAKEEKAAAQKSWRDVTIDELEFSGAIHKALTDAGLTTRGAIADWSNAHNGLHDIPDIGPGRITNIAERLDAWDRNHPEYHDRPQAELPRAANA